METKQRFIIKLNWVDWFTLLGVLSSGFAIILALYGKFAYSLCFLFIAMVTDAMDGFLARSFNLLRPFGRYLDSCIDELIYLTGPSVMLYLWGFQTWYYALILGLFMISGIVRLSVFNEIGNVPREGKKMGYLGMPVFWSLFIIGFFFILSWWVPKPYLFPFLALSLLIFSYLMVYNGNFFKFKSWKVLLLICILCALIFGLDGAGVFDFAKTVVG
jgi:CDP-diacylglycerol--serine O-phosphatidyltransferase